MLIGYNWPNETKLLRGVPILVERCEFISKMFSFVFAWRPKVLEICIEKIHFLRKKWEFFQKSPLFPAIFPIFAKIAYFPSGGTVWKRRPPKKRRLKWCGWTEYMFIYIISSAAKLVEWNPSSLQVQKYLGSTDTKQMHVEHKNRTKNIANTAWKENKTLSGPPESSNFCWQVLYTSWGDK